MVYILKKNSDTMVINLVSSNFFYLLWPATNCGKKLTKLRFMHNHVAFKFKADIF